MNVPLEDFSLGVAAAKYRRFVADADESGFSHVAHGYHLSAHEYVNAIARAAIDVGVKRIVGQLKTVNIGNCLAIGSAAAVLEPLDALQQHLFLQSSCRQYGG